MKQCVWERLKNICVNRMHPKSNVPFIEGKEVNYFHDIRHQAIRHALYTASMQIAPERDDVSIRHDSARREALQWQEKETRMGGDTGTATAFEQITNVTAVCYEDC